MLNFAKVNHYLNDIYKAPHHWKKLGANDMEDYKCRLDGLNPRNGHDYEYLRKLIINGNYSLPFIEEIIKTSRKTLKDVLSFLMTIHNYEYLKKLALTFC